MLTLITGGARSGKSTFAQTLCQSHNKVVYIATATDSDSEMHMRIARHQASRPSAWHTEAEPLDVPAAVDRLAPQADVFLIDCLTLWLSNLMYEWRTQTPDCLEATIRAESERLISASNKTTIVAVTNEVGSGIVPTAAVARQFRDLQGTMNQQIAQSADAVFLLVCGIPLSIKPSKSETAWSNHE